MRTECGMRRIVTTRFVVPKCTWFKVSFWAITSSVSKLSLPLFTTRWSQEIDTSVTLTKSSIFRSCHLARFYRPLGTVTWFLCVVWPNLRLTKQMPFPPRPSWIKSQRRQFQTLVIPQLCALLLFALTWVAFPFRTSVRIKVGSAFVTDPSTTSSDVLDRVLRSPTFPGSTIKCMAPSSVLRRCNIPTSPLFSSMSDLPYHSTLCLIYLRNHSHKNKNAHLRKFYI